jgi:hypothetical protein
MDTSTEPFLKIANRVLVHRVDIIDLAELLQVEAAADRAATSSSKHEEKPLVERLPCAALSALKNGAINESIAEGTGNPDQFVSAYPTISHSRHQQYRQNVATWVRNSGPVT